MANINLISARRAERVRLARVFRGLMGLGVALATVGFLAFGFLTFQVLLTRNAVAEREKQLEALRTVVQQIESMEREKKELLPKITTLAEAQTRTHHWMGVLEEMKKALPESTWLTSLGVERTAEGEITLRINGITDTQARVGETMYRLNLVPAYYKRVDLRYSQVTQSLEGERIEFELAAQLKPPDESQAAAAADAAAATTPGSEPSAGSTTPGQGGGNGEVKAN